MVFSLPYPSGSQAPHAGNGADTRKEEVLGRGSENTRSLQPDAQGGWVVTPGTHRLGWFTVVHEEPLPLSIGSQ